MVDRGNEMKSTKQKPFCHCTNPHLYGIGQDYTYEAMTHSLSLDSLRCHKVSVRIMFGHYLSVSIFMINFF